VNPAAPTRYGKTPMQTFLDSLPMAREKLLDQQNQPSGIRGSDGLQGKALERGLPNQNFQHFPDLTLLREKVI
jgi:hypothetical protein